MSDDTPTVRQRVHEVINEVTPWENDNDDDPTPEHGVVTGWLLVAEWQSSDGLKWLSKLSGNAMGDNGLPGWTERGFANEVQTHWPE